MIQGDANSQVESDASSVTLGRENGQSPETLEGDSGYESDRLPALRGFQRDLKRHYEEDEEDETPRKCRSHATIRPLR